MRHRSPAFTLRMGTLGAESLALSGFAGREALSRPFDFRVDFSTRDGAPLAAADLVGRDALLTVSVRDGSPRHVHGVVREVESLGLKEGRWRYRAHVVPELWRLSQVHRSRIFQNKSVPEVISAVLREGGVEARLALSGSYAAREYCVQYRESDFAFVSRLMEWEGIFYFFEHSDSGHTLVLGDRPSAHAPLPQGRTLPLRPRKGAVDDEFVYALEVVHRLRPGAVHLKDFDFEKPAVDLSGKGKAPEGVAALEIYDYPAGYVAPGVGKAAATVRAEAVGVGGRTLTGEAIAPRLTPGFLLELEAPEDGTFAGEYLVTEVVHSGVQPDVSGGSESLQGLYRNQFHLLPKAVPFRPRRLTPLPQIAGPQTATVTGPAGEEIHTDAHGRIQVRFHWDRDEKSSCWVRVGQPWGDLWLPRIGQEVIVRFLEGDPDRPLVAGAVYNGANPVPYALPDEKTKSTRKSASSLGSDGFNEVRIEDAAGEEEVFTHAQKDEALLTENDKDQQVRGSEELRVKKDRERTVEGHQELRVGCEDDSEVEGHQSLRVQGNRSTTVAKCHDETVEGHQTMTVGGNLTVQVRQTSVENVAAAKATTVGGAYSINVALAHNAAAGGAKTEQVAGLKTEFIAGLRQESVSGDKHLQLGGEDWVDVDGHATLTIGKDWNVQAREGLHLRTDEGHVVHAKSFEWVTEQLSISVNKRLVFQVDKSGRVQCFGGTLTFEEE